MENNTLYSPSIFVGKEQGKYTILGYHNKTLQEFINDKKHSIIYFHVIDKQFNYKIYPSKYLHKTKRQNKASITQIKSWDEVKNSSMLQTQTMQVLSILENTNKSLCCRDIEEISNIRESSLTRTLHNLKLEGKIIVAKIDKSIHTGKDVFYYTINNLKQQIPYSKLPEFILKLNEFR